MTGKTSGDSTGHLRGAAGIDSVGTLHDGRSATAAVSKHARTVTNHLTKRFVGGDKPTKGHISSDAVRVRESGNAISKQALRVHGAANPKHKV